MKFLSFITKLAITLGAVFALIKFLEKYFDDNPTSYVVSEDFDIDD